jgi:hypothetical protein
MTQSLRVLFITIATMAMAMTSFPLTALAQDAITAPGPGEIIIVPGTATLNASLDRAVRAAFRNAAVTFKLNTYYSVTGLQLNRGWYFISMAGFDTPLARNQHWSLEDGQVWMGLVLATRNAKGTWTSAVEGTNAFTALLDKVPRTVLSPSAKLSIDPTRRRNALPDIYRFPWQVGTSMMYGMKGVHEGGFAILGTYKAVDLLSDGDVSVGHAPNNLLAAAPGAINYVCDDGTSVAIRVGDLLYVHLMNNPKLKVGYSFATGEEIGPLRTGWFSSVCGYADQGENWFHIHWAFPTGDTFQAGGWTLSMRDQLWHRGTETRGIYEWLTADSPRWHVQYFSDANLSAPCNEGDEEAIFLFKQWDSAADPSASAQGCTPGNFSARFSRPVSFSGGDYTFRVEHRGGVMLKIDDRLILDAWKGGSDGITATLALSGVHDVSIEFVRTTDSPLVNVWWYGPGALSIAGASAPATKGWRAEYFGNYDLWGQPILVLNQEGPINRDWGLGGTGYGLPKENFSIRYTRLAEFKCGRFRFNVHADDGVRIRVGDRLVLDAWREQVADFQPLVDLPGGNLPVLVEYFQRSQSAALAVDWERVAGSSCAEIRRK